MKTFGRSLKELRKNKGLTQEELAAAVGVYKTTIGHWERGICFPDILVASDLADILGVSLDTLVGRKSF